MFVSWWVAYSRICSCHDLIIVSRGHYVQEAFFAHGSNGLSVTKITIPGEDKRVCFIKTPHLIHFFRSSGLMPQLRLFPRRRVPHLFVVYLHYQGTAISVREKDAKGAEVEVCVSLFLATGIIPPHQQLDQVFHVATRVCTVMCHQTQT